ncbi:unnamed protein product [Ilex paraguariensis]|uniref:Uncharacterized protein n=1 Tax=Ilex paraguariensis TaxID=185542 RepID=A0ABC8SES3_9AQUA
MSLRRSSSSPVVRSHPENSVDHFSITMETPSDHPRTRNTEMKISNPAYPRSDSSPEELAIDTDNTNQSQDLNPIVRLFRDLDLSKILLGLGVTLAAALVKAKDSDSSVVSPLTVLSLCIGLAASWNGLLLRTTFHTTSIVLEQIGAVCILFAFYGVVGSLLPPQFSWASWANKGAYGC